MFKHNPDRPDIGSTFGSIPPDPFAYYPGGYDSAGGYHGTYGYVEISFLEQALLEFGYPQALFQFRQGNPTATSRGDLYFELAGRRDGRQASLLNSPYLLAENSAKASGNAVYYTWDGYYFTDVRPPGVAPGTYFLVSADGVVTPFREAEPETVTVIAPREPPTPPISPPLAPPANGPGAATMEPIPGARPYIAALTEQMLYRDLKESGYSTNAVDKLNKYYEQQFPLSEGNLRELLLKRSAAFATAYEGQLRQKNYRYALGNLQAGLLDLAGATIAGGSWKETAENLAKGMLLGGVLGTVFGALRGSGRPVVASESASDIGGTRGPRASLPATMNKSLSAEKPTFLENDVDVGYGADHTRVGNDWETIRTTEARKPWPGFHDAVVHSASKGGGRTLAPGVADPLPSNPLNSYPVETHVAQIAEAIKWNPNLRPGQPIRVLSCALDPVQAQELANLTGHPIFASPFVVGVEAGTGELVVQQYITRAAADGYLTDMNLTGKNVSDKQVWNVYWPLE